eukprot:PhM_4_TR17458/c3_g1_i5/m.36754
MKAITSRVARNPHRAVAGFISELNNVKGIVVSDEAKGILSAISTFSVTHIVTATKHHHAVVLSPHSGCVELSKNDQNIRVLVHGVVLDADILSHRIDLHFPSWITIDCDNGDRSSSRMSVVLAEVFDGSDLPVGWTTVLPNTRTTENKCDVVTVPFVDLIALFSDEGALSKLNSCVDVVDVFACAFGCADACGLSDEKLADSLQRDEGSIWLSFLQSRLSSSLSSAFPFWLGGAHWTAQAALQRAYELCPMDSVLWECVVKVLVAMKESMYVSNTKMNTHNKNPFVRFWAAKESHSSRRCFKVTSVQQAAAWMQLCRDYDSELKKEHQVSGLEDQRQHRGRTWLRDVPSKVMSKLAGNKTVQTAHPNVSSHDMKTDPPYAGDDAFSKERQYLFEWAVFVAIPHDDKLFPHFDKCVLDHRDVLLAARAVCKYVFDWRSHDAVTCRYESLVQESARTGWSSQPTTSAALRVKKKAMNNGTDDALNHCDVSDLMQAYECLQTVAPWNAVISFVFHISF